MPVPSSIFAVALTCRKRFQECLSYPSLCVNDWAELQLANFNLWASRSGALTKERASLDERLTLRPDVKEIVTGSLRILEIAVEQCQQSARQHNEQSSGKSNEATYSSTIESVDSLLERQNRVKHMIHQLVKLVVAIRRSGNRAHLQRADQQFSSDRHGELRKHLLVMLFVGRLTESEKCQGNIAAVCHEENLEDIQSRLLTANLRRRGRFLYAQKHSRKLEQEQTSKIKKEQLDPESAAEIAPGVQLPRHVLGEAHVPEQQTNTLGPPLENICSELTSTDASVAEGPINITQGGPVSTVAASSTCFKMEYPPAPKVETGQEFAKCPCCCLLLPSFYWSGRKWRDHLVEDLSPYTCVLKNCPDPLQLYSNTKDWMNHMQREHKNSQYWLCFACDGLTKFDKEGDFTAHLKRQHKDTILQENIDTFTSIYARTAPIEVTACPLCPPNSHQGIETNVLLEHVAIHIHSFALSSFPWPEPGEREKEYVGTYKQVFGETEFMAHYFQLPENPYFDVDLEEAASGQTQDTQSDERSVGGLAEAWFEQPLSSSEQEDSSHVEDTEPDITPPESLDTLLKGLARDGDSKRLQKEDMINDWLESDPLAIYSELNPAIHTNREVKLDPHDMGRESTLSSESNTAAKGQMTVGGVTNLTDEIHQPYFYIQLAKNTHFTGRTTILNMLEKRFFGKDRSQKVALLGLGGVGKTQIALHFAYQVKEKWPDYSVFWVSTLSNESTEQAYDEIATMLNLQKSSKDEDIKKLVCLHLSLDKVGKWLFIIDNIDDEELFFRSTDKPGLEEFLPRNKNGIVLLTTRSRQIAVKFAQSEIINIGQMDQLEAAALLEKSLIQKQLFQDEVLVAELLARLSFMPLAITQAAAYLNQNKAPIQTYLELLRDVGEDVPGMLGSGHTTHNRSSRNTVGATWLVSFDQIQKLDQVAVDLLSFISCIEPTAIPQSILPYFEHEKMLRAVGLLCGYSFLFRRKNTNTFDMHSLIHRAMREWVRKQGRTKQVVDDAISHLTDIFPPNDSANYSLRKEYLPHAMKLLYQINQNRTNNVYYLSRQVGDCLSTERRFKEAMMYYKDVCYWKQKQLSENDHSRLTSEHSLAGAYLNNGHIKDAIKILKHVVTIRKATLDKKDHSRLASEHDLASAYLNNGQIEDAIKMFEYVVAVEKETLDEKDRSRLASEHELARAYLNDRRPNGRRIKDAIKMLEHVVAVEKETLDEKDHSRLASEHELARAYLNDRRIEDAIKMFEHVVTVEKETLDEKDHSRLASEHSLAKAYLDYGQIRDAIRILQHVVAVESKILSHDDPSRLLSLDLLATAKRGI